MWTQSLTPARRTLWLPTGRPAFVSLSTARADLGRDLVRVVEVEVDPERVVLLEHRAELVVDPLRQEDRHPRADPDDLDVGDLAEAAEDRLEELRGERQAVAAGDEHVADLRRPAQVLELGLVVLAVEVLGRVADDPRPRAVAAVARALGRDEHQDAVRVAMHEAGHRGVAVLGERVLHHRREGLLLAPERDDLAADRVVRVVGVDQADEVRRDVDPELVRGGQARRAPRRSGSRTCSISSRSLTRWLSCQRQSFHFSSGTSSQIGARRLTAGRPSGPSAWAGSRRLTNGASASGALRVLVGDRRLDLLGVQPSRPPCASRRRVHKEYALCKSADDRRGASGGPPDGGTGPPSRDGRPNPVARR